MKITPEQQTKEHWLIMVSGYGSFVFVGTEEEAEEMRVHKARWEGSIGRKQRITKEEAEEYVRHGAEVMTVLGSIPPGYRLVPEEVAERPDLQQLLQTVRKESAFMAPVGPSPTLEWAKAVTATLEALASAVFPKEVEPYG